MPYRIRDKIQFLAETSKILSSSLDFNVTLAIIAKLAVSNFADFCMIDILDSEGKLTRVAAQVADRKKQKLANKMFEFPSDPRNKQAIYDTARTGFPILIKEINDKWLKSASKIPEEREIIKKLGLHSFMFAPLKSRENIIGVLTLVSSDPELSYNEDDLLLAEELANRAGVAVDNARLFSEAKEAVRTRDEFLSIASHELKTPLTSILLNLQLLLKKIQESDGKKTDMNEIIKAIESSERQSYRLSKLINDLLNVSVTSTGRLQLEKENVDLSSLVEDILLRFEIQLMKAGIKVKLINPVRIRGRWDKVRIEQVITNLLSNAIKYGKGKPVTIGIEKRNKSAVIKIKDKGIGIKDSDKKRIFERFGRAVSVRDYRGLGVGLYISQQIIEAHKGKLTVESKENKGSTFTLELPLA